jgi:type II secretory pathway pseudopilin PulG
MRSVKFYKQLGNSGQTLIETVIAIFILVSGITAAVGLAIYAFSSSQNVTKQIIAVGLAREGIEAVKNMRDTNWLKIPSLDSDCYNFVTSNNDAPCYKQWMNPSGGFNYNLLPASDEKEYRLGIDPVGSLFWQLNLENASYGLNFDSNVSGVGFTGYYNTPNSGGVLNGSSDFYRKITLRTNGTNDDPPFDHTAPGPRLHVVVQVWWTEKKCPRVTDWPGLGKCSIELQTYLTNWKNY